MSMVVRTERKGPVFWIVIDRPAQRNAMNEAVAAGIVAAFDAAESDPDVRAIVLTGAGDKAFCAGSDLAPNAEGAPFTIDPARPNNPVVALFLRIEASGLPVVARVNGHALAGGLGLMCACDLAVASRAATFGTPESGIGLFPMMILPYLQRVLPRRRLMEMCITGERFSAEAALEMELVNYIAEPADLDTKLDWLLARITNKSPTSVRLGKQGFRAMEDMTLRQAFEYAQLMLPMMAATEDAREGFAAFRERRPPNWTGR